MNIGKMAICKLGCAALAGILCVACLVGCGGTGEDQSGEPTANTTAASECAGHNIFTNITIILHNKSPNVADMARNC